MNTKLVTAIIISLLIGAGIGYSVSVLQISTLSSENISLQSKVSSLESDKKNLESQILKLETDYDSLNNSYNELRIEYELLPTIYRERDADYKTLNATLNELQTICEEMEARIVELGYMVDYEVYALTGREYYYSIIDGFQNANETIFVAMYSMIYDPDDSVDWANDLIRELVYASQRGVDVRVIVEYETYWDTITGNLETYNYLLDNGVDVRLDINETTTDHMKLVIIDGEIVYIGSHNWSESALYYNTETSVKIFSQDIARYLREYLET